MINHTLDQYIQTLRSEMQCCIQTEEVHYHSGDNICEDSQKGTSRLGLVLHGQAILYTLDLYGNRNIIDLLQENDVFGELFALSSPDNRYYVEARSDCQVLFLDYDNLNHRCDGNCIHHEKILSSLFYITSHKSQETMMHYNIISQRNIRNKLLTLFAHLGLDNAHPTTLLPFSWTEAADYICTERSAMMRELGKMRTEGIISWNGRSITLYL